MPRVLKWKGSECLLQAGHESHQVNRKSSGWKLRENNGAGDWTVLPSLTDTSWYSRKNRKWASSKSLAETKRGQKFSHQRKVQKPSEDWCVERSTIPSQFIKRYLYCTRCWVLFFSFCCFHRKENVELNTSNCKFEATLPS